MLTHNIKLLSLHDLNLWQIYIYIYDKGFYLNDIQ